MTGPVIAETHDKVGLIRIDRPEALNALNDEVIDGIGHALARFEADASIGCIVLTGSDKAFAAGADIDQMKDFGYMDAYRADFITRNWERLKTCRKPTIAAVAGYALGGGCEMAMMCDMIYAAENAKFGQPEIKLGVTPGMGGSIRLTKAVGKAKAMDLVLTGRMIDAAEADRIGLVSRVVPHDTLMEAALAAANEIAAFSVPSLMAAKEMVARALELPTTEGVKFERRLFQGLFGTADQKEGMAAFTEKRAARFEDK